MATETQNTVEIVERMYEGYNKGDIDSVLALMADDVEWTEPEGFVFGGTYHSPKSVLQDVFEPSMEEFETFTVEPERYIDGGDTVVALGTFHATTKAKEQIESPFVHIVEIHDGHITKFENHTDTALWQ
ncbi:nuclear transport factor 2 family protein [Haloarchaeobius sp. HRN-SO-5]|uniref:nuclear transport factor 2 family protein n=1 Tax=Haloarchaeobius sp. HRN-SO-5 TaxID=3446118 RepID=UPI003EB8BD35